jgi:hypothetical protein
MWGSSQSRDPILELLLNLPRAIDVRIEDVVIHVMFEVN